MTSPKTTIKLATYPKSAKRDKRLIRACEIANHDPGLREIEKEFDAFTDEIPEPWEDAPNRPARS